MAVARFKAATLDSVTYTLAAGYQDDGSYASHTEVTDLPVFVTSIVIKTNKLQASTRFLALYNKANISDVTLGTTPAALMIPFGPGGMGGSGLGQTTVSNIFSKQVQKIVFPDGGLAFSLGCKIAQLVMGTITDNTLASTTGLAEEVLVFFRPALVS